MKNGKLTVAIVGMGFGSCFLPIYLKHPDVEHVIMVDTNPDQLKALADMYLLDESYYTPTLKRYCRTRMWNAAHLVIPPALPAPCRFRCSTQASTAPAPSPWVCP